MNTLSDNLLIENIALSLTESMTSNKEGSVNCQNCHFLYKSFKLHSRKHLSSQCRKHHQKVLNLRKLCHDWQKRYFPPYRYLSVLT